MNKNSLIRYKDGSVWPLLEDRMNRVFSGFFDDLWATSPLQNAQTNFNPQFNVEENKECFLVSAELPGISEDNIEVTCERGNLVISGHKKEDYDRNENGIHYVGRSYGSFQKSIPFSDQIAEDKIEAKLDKGVLRVVLPKNNTNGERTKRIAVKSIN